MENVLILKVLDDNFQFYAQGIGSIYRFKFAHTLLMYTENTSFNA